MAERGNLPVREDDAEAKSAETRRNRRTKEGRARPAIYRRLQDGLPRHDLVTAAETDDAGNVGCGFCSV
jgi:hypothetical protein